MIVKARQSMAVTQKSFWLDEAHARALPDRPIVVDGFAGGGGASTGIRMALGRDVDVAINHDRSAIAMHMVNHPQSKHYCENIYDVDPVEACEGRPIAMAWFSPDCTHFSKARGKAPVKKEIRGLAQAIIPWASMDKALRPRVIFVENVSEFQTWGPIDDAGQPIKARAGETFMLWIIKLQELGYAVEFRELVASDYGAPTTRKRLFIIARCDGRPIVWPAPTHGGPAQIAKELATQHSCRRKPWRTAAEIIDWSIPCPSIFLTKAEAKAAGCIRPLADKTMARIAEGIRRYVIETANPFIVTVNHGGWGIVCPHLVSYYGPKPGDGGGRGRSLEYPLATVTTENRFGLVTPYMLALHNGGGLRRLDDPMRTIAASDGDCHCLVTPFLSSTANQGTTGRAPYCWPVREPLRTLTTTNDKVVIAPMLSRMFGHSIGSSCEAPVGSLTSENKTAVVSAFIAKHFGGMVGIPANRPFPTVTTRGTQNQLVAATLIKNNHGADQVRAFLFKYFGTGGAISCDCPVSTLTTKDRLGLGIVLVQGQPWQIVDIGMRMLSPRELFLAQGFPSDYIIDRGEDGRPLTKSAQVARCGNSVPPTFAEALVRANLPEICHG